MGAPIEREEGHLRVLRITGLGASFPDDARPSRQVNAYDTLSGDVEEEETQKPDTKNTCVHLLSSCPPPCSRMKKPLGQPSLSK